MSNIFSSWWRSFRSWASLFWAELSWGKIGRFFISPFFAAFIYFAGGLYANSVLQVVADRQVVQCGEEACAPSPDLGHDWFPHIQDVAICDYWLYLTLGLTLVRFSPLFISRGLSATLFRRWLFLQGTLFWFRGISVALTRQSIPQESCVSTATGNAWVEGFYIMVGIHRTCGDIMYSGHTAALTLATLIWTHYSHGEEFALCFGDVRPWIVPNVDAVGDPATCSLTAVVCWAVTLGGYFFIIATRFHYSNDVWIGYLITQFVFRVYHHYIKTVLERPGWFARAFRWFEGFDRSLQLQGDALPSPMGIAGPMLHASKQLQGGDLEAGYAKKEHAQAQAILQNNGQNKHESVRPMSGIPIAVFSEGPLGDSGVDDKDSTARQHLSRKDSASDELGLTPPKVSIPGLHDAPLLARNQASSGSSAREYERMEAGPMRAQAAAATARPQPLVAGEVASQYEEDKRRPNTK